MGNFPKVSVIITTKNSAATLLTLLKSVKSQSYKYHEIVVVDNNSTDDTLKIARKYTELVFTKGPERSAQRNFGASKAKGKYLLFLDSDMELTKDVLKDCVNVISENKSKIVTLPEKTVGKGFLSKVRAFEREMYMGDDKIEVARLFDRDLFFEYKGYDEDLTGPEDYDLPYRMSKKHKIDRSHEYILHHEDNVTLSRLLSKKYYYAKVGAIYAQKHPELIKSQGNLLFRKAYLRNWRRFVNKPLIGLTFILVRVLEAASAVLGYISAVGVQTFIKSLMNLVK